MLKGSMKVRWIYAKATIARMRRFRLVPIRHCVGVGKKTADPIALNQVQVPCTCGLPLWLERHILNFAPRRLVNSTRYHRVGRLSGSGRLNRDLDEHGRTSQ